LQTAGDRLKPISTSIANGADLRRATGWFRDEAPGQRAPRINFSIEEAKIEEAKSVGSIN
jgi:hypothetical protein